MHQFAIDQPKEKGGSDLGMNSSEIFLSSLGSCIAFYTKRYCQGANIDPSGLIVDTFGPDDTSGLFLRFAPFALLGTPRRVPKRSEVQDFRTHSTTLPSRCSPRAEHSVQGRTVLPRLRSGWFSFDVSQDPSNTFDCSQCSTLSIIEGSKDPE